ncbi:MAG TPA: DUF6146 family protein [Bacteroidales bacterium]|nr:DUF6146 family protein [Bacteroidales bacterium]
MKKIALSLLIVISLTLWMATPEASAQHHPKSAADSLMITSVDSTEYEIAIIATGFDSWLIGHAKPRWYYSNEYYRTKNNYLVSKWNRRVRETMHQEPYEYLIDYLPGIDYGLEVNYQLYWYFRYIENEYGIDLGIPATD